MEKNRLFVWNQRVSNNDERVLHSHLIFNIPVNPAFTSEKLSSRRTKEDEFRKMPEQVRRYSNTLRAMHMYSFMLNKDGKPISLATTSPEKLVECI